MAQIQRLRPLNDEEDKNGAQARETVQNRGRGNAAKSTDEQQSTDTKPTKTKRHYKKQKEKNLRARPLQPAR